MLEAWANLNPLDKRAAALLNSVLSQWHRDYVKKDRPPVSLSAHSDASVAGFAAVDRSVRASLSLLVLGLCACLGPRQYESVSPGVLRWSAG